MKDYKQGGRIYIESTQAKIKERIDKDGMTDKVKEYLLSTQILIIKKHLAKSAYYQSVNRKDIEFQDIFQDFYVYFFKYINSYNPDLAPLTHFTKNMIRNYVSGMITSERIPSKFANYQNDYDYDETFYTNYYNQQLDEIEEEVSDYQRIKVIEEEIRSILTKKQRRIFDLSKKGYKNIVIAERLNIHSTTVKISRENAQKRVEKHFMKKYGISLRDLL